MTIFAPTKLSPSPPALKRSGPRNIKRAYKKIIKKGQVSHICNDISYVLSLKVFIDTRYFEEIMKRISNLILEGKMKE